MAEKFILFDDAIKELKMSADELKKLMDDGKIRHFMDSGKIKFRQKDVDDLKASLGIKAAEEDELVLAPSEEVPPVPPAPGADEVPPPPPATYKEEEFAIEPLDEGPTPATIGSRPPTTAKKPEAAPAAPPAEEKAEEVASLSDFEATGAEDTAALSGEEAEMLAMQGSLRGYEEAREGNVGMTVLLVVGAAVLFFGIAVLLSFPAGINPFSGLTGLFANQ